MADDQNRTPEPDPEILDIEALLRDLDPDELALEEAPVGVWTGIEARLGAEVTSGSDPTIGRDHDAVVVPVRRRRGWLYPALAAAAVIVVVVAAVAIVGRGSESEPTTVASADLTHDAAAFDPAGADAAATALLLDDGGDEVLEIDAESLPFDLDEDASLELWMIRVDDGQIVDMVSLGDIDEEGARDFAVPEGYDPAVYSVVDISIEPHDGDATHSGRSILRGVLGPV